MPTDWMSINTGPPDVDGMSITDVDGKKADVDQSERDGGMSMSISERDVDWPRRGKRCDCGLGPWTDGICQNTACGGVDVETARWVPDSREEAEPWRRKHGLEECGHREPGGALCGVLIRGSDRCADHKRRCWGTNAKGEPCKSPPLKGTWEDPTTGETRDVDWCAAHPRQEAAAQDHPLAVGDAFGSPERSAEAGRLGGLARRYPRLNEEITRQIEERAAQVVGAGIEALDATKPVVVEESGTDENGRRFTRQEVVEYPDHLVRLKAHEALTSRAFGRPHQAMDINQETRQLTLALDATDPVVREGLHSFLRQRPGVAA